MDLLFPILIIPFALFLSLIFNTFGDLSHRASEQVRLDAYTLSICHKRAKFIEKEIQAANRLISIIQVEMDVVAASCEASLAIPILGEGICAGAIADLKVAARAGRAIELKQFAAQVAFAGEFRLWREDLAHRNHLQKSLDAVSEHYGHLRTSRIAWELPWGDGFERERISAIRRAWELQFGARWPKQLVPSESFELKHQILTDFRPKRRLLDARENNSGVLKSSQHQVQDGGESQTHSGCQILPDTFEVRRIE